MSTKWEIKVDTEGNITSSVKGLKGSGCTELTKDFEKEAGAVVTDNPTREMSEKEPAREYNKNRF